jgi:peptide/nickel transport system permease protein
MVKEARIYASQTPWALFYPASAIAILVIGINLLADGLKRVFRIGDQ